VCLYRDAGVVVTSWTDAPIPWPRCRAVDSRGGSGLLVDEELARAMRSESSLAIQRWWGVSPRAVWCWRQALGVGRADPEGSRRLIRANAEAGAAQLRGKQLSDEECDRRAERAKARDLVRYVTPGYHGRQWTKEELFPWQGRKSLRGRRRIGHRGAGSSS